jgi:hypothetical protein
MQRVGPLVGSFKLWPLPIQPVARQARFHVQFVTLVGPPPVSPATSSSIWARDAALSGWNTGHGSFTFNERVFPDPAEIVAKLQQENIHVVLHVVNPPEGLHGTVDQPANPAEENAAANVWAKIAVTVLPVKGFVHYRNRGDLHVSRYEEGVGIQGE